MRLFVYPRLGAACDNKQLLSKAVNLHLWEVSALELLKRSLHITTDAAHADVFLIDECLQLEYFSLRPFANSGFFGCPRCHNLDARVVTAMRRIGGHWDTAPRRHIVTHLECPRIGHADALDPAFPELWATRRSLVLCVQNSRPGRPDVLRTMHLPYYAHSQTGIQPIVPAINRTVDFLFAGTFSAWYPRAWLRDAMLPAASSRLLLFESREASTAELARLNALGRCAIDSRTCTHTCRLHANGRTHEASCANTANTADTSSPGLPFTMEFAHGVADLHTSLYLRLATCPRRCGRTRPWRWGRRPFS